MNNKVTVTSNDFLTKPVKDIFSVPPIKLPEQPKTDINAFNQQMVNAQPGQSNFKIPTVSSVPPVNPPGNANAGTTPATTSSLSQYHDQPVSYMSEYGQSLKERATAYVPTEAEAQAQALRNMQAEIDATNTLYADKLRRAQVLGQGLLGQTGAIQARRGLLGSDFGTAQTQNVNATNESVYSDIENEKAVKIAQIQSKAKEDATAAMEAKRIAKQTDSKTYVEFLAQERADKDKRLKNSIQEILANKIDLKDYTEGEIAALAKTYEVSSARLKSEFAQAKSTIASEQAKLAAEQAKAGRMTLTEGQRVFQIDPKTGEYKQVAYNPKTYKATTGTSGGGSVFGSAYTGGGTAESASIIEQARTLTPQRRGYAEQFNAGRLASIPNNLRNQAASDAALVNQEKGVLVANQILKQLDNGIAALTNNQGFFGAMSGSLAGRSIPFFGSPARFNQEVENFRTVLDTLRAAQTINAIPLMKGTGPLSNADMRILENSQTELSETLDEATLLEKMQQLRNELEPARLGNKPGPTMQPVGGVNASPANQPTMSDQVRAEAEANGYDYDQMVADGLSDAEIMESL